MQTVKQTLLVLVSVLKVAIAVNEKAAEKNRVVLTWVKKTLYERVDSAAGLSSSGMLPTW